MTMWMILSAVLALVTAYVGWQLRQSKKDWEIEELYYRRHEEPLPEGGEAKEIYGADPNVSNSRQERKEAEKSREVYERTVEKLKTHAPKTFRRLNSMKKAELG
ncbi:MAG: hypothetical protein Q4D82_04595, partial [Neisseria sp.]|nr:hypothetical protein [Neisseria sp.]